MEPIAFHALGIPKGQPRPKACIRGKHAGVYDPGTANSWKEAVAWQAKAARPATPFEETVQVFMHFEMPRPKWMDAKKYAGLLSVPVATKPDVDNLAKAVLDVMTELGFWRDDSLVATLFVRKVYAASGERPGVRVKVVALSPL